MLLSCQLGMIYDTLAYSSYSLSLFQSDGLFLSTSNRDDILTRIAKRSPKLYKGGNKVTRTRYTVLHEYNEVMVTSFKEANSDTIRFRVTNDASPDDAAYAGSAKNVERRMRLERSNAGGAGQYEVWDSMTSLRLSTPTQS
mmetsp:Transcript_40096/g.73355  ORF Transcript_40096/g.73355 Transcript_40096/m.73355 type:complete len:141 (+) Transcript_40096:562-984(+)